MNLKEQFAAQGVVVIPNVIDHHVVERSVADIWSHIEGLPWKEEGKKVWRELHDAFRTDYWRDVTKSEAERIAEWYPMTGGFGALTLPGAFHLATQWEIRQNPQVVEHFASLLGTDDLEVALDRISFKAPGMGTTEFIHWDSNPWFWPEEDYEGLQGIVALSDTSFFAAPGTHTSTFREDFITKYPKTTRRDQYLIDLAADPLKLQTQVVEYKLKKGDLVVWSNRLLHEARSNSRNTNRYAHFLTYYPAGKHPKAVLKAYSKGVKKPTSSQLSSSQRDALAASDVKAYAEGKKSLKALKEAPQLIAKDRTESYQTGCNPRFFPSGTPIELYAKTHWMYHPTVIVKFTSRFEEWISEERTYASGKKKGTIVRVPTNFTPRTYVPPTLTNLGKKLLGAHR